MKKPNVIFSNIDIDGTPKEKMYKTGASMETLANILEKIAKIKGVSIIEITESSRKGYHIRIMCDSKQKCEMVKLVFDDYHRLYKDLNRPYYHREVLFNSFKIFISKNRY